MNSQNPKLEKLLEDVLPEASNPCGPDHATVVSLLHHEQSRRQRKRLILSTMTICLLTAVLFFQQSDRIPKSASVVTEKEDITPPHLQIREVTDGQLLELLSDIPAALMEWPNGDRTLLVIAAPTPAANSEHLPPAAARSGSL